MINWLEDREVEVLYCRIGKLHVGFVERIISTQPRWSVYVFSNEEAESLGERPTKEEAKAVLEQKVRELSGLFVD